MYAGYRPKIKTMSDKNLEQQFKDLQEQFEKLSQQQTSLASENANLRNELTELTKLANKAAEGKQPPQKPVVPTKEFSSSDKSDKRKFVFVAAQFTLPPSKALDRPAAVTMTALDALSDQKVLNELIARQSGVIKEVK